MDRMRWTQPQEGLMGVSEARFEFTKAGFHSLSMGEVDLSSLPEVLQKKRPKHPVPVAEWVDWRLIIQPKAKA